MNDEKIQKGIKEIKKITMTADEKKRVFNNILNSLLVPKPIHSPWFNYSFLFQMKRTQLAYFVIIPLIFVLSGSGVIFASYDAQPDNFLYPIKVKIIEPITGFLKRGEVAKAKYESSLATKRLIEAETLASNGKLDAIKEKQINNLLQGHTRKLNNALERINKSEVNNADEIVINFRAEMNTHAKVLENIKENNKDTKDNNNKENNKNNNDEKRGNQISETARDSADTIKEKQKKDNGNNEDKNNKKAE